jgi:hypothetical protein
MRNTVIPNSDEIYIQPWLIYSVVALAILVVTTVATAVASPNRSRAKR